MWLFAILVRQSVRFSLLEALNLVQEGFMSLRMLWLPYMPSIRNCFENEYIKQEKTFCRN